MAYTGREIKAFLTLDVSRFNKGLDTAKSKSGSLNKDLNGLKNTTNNLGKSAGNASKEVNKASKSTQTMGNSAQASQSKIIGLRSAMNLLKITAGLLAITLGIDLAMGMMQVARSAVNAEGQIMGMAKGMGWSTKQVKDYINEISRLQPIYRKTDMNAVGIEVAKMARIYKLNANEAKNFIETSAVFSSAMAMEGRSARDSALALKDLIDQGQGWERRMSEIGITAKELKATGLWHGDKDDKKGLIGALNVVLEKRSLTKIAQEINSLDDAVQVLTIAGGQLLGAFLIPLTPAILAVTMALADMAYGVKNIIGLLLGLWNALPGWIQLPILIGGAVIAFGLLGKILLTTLIPAASAAVLSFVNMLLPLFGVNATAISASGGFTLLAGAIWSALAPLLPFIAAGAALALVVYQTGIYFGWWKDIPTLIEAIKNGVTRLWNAFIHNKHVLKIVEWFRVAWRGILDYFAPLTESFQEFWNNLLPSGQRFDIVRSIIDIFGWLGDTVVKVWGFFQNHPLGQVLGLLAIFSNPLLFIILNFNKIVWVATTAANAVKSFFSAFYDDKGNFVGLLQGFQNAFGMLLDWIWNWASNVDWIGLFTSIGETIMKYNPLSLMIGMIFGTGEGGELIDAITAWAASVDWEGIMTAMFQLVAQYNPITFMIRLWFGDEAGTQFSNMLFTVFMTAGQILITGVTILMNIITTLSTFVTTTWTTIRTATLQAWTLIYTTINNLMTRILGVVAPYTNRILIAWNNMKNGLVSAANTIRDRVWGPIKTLWDRLASFWSFLMNPGGGGRVSVTRSTTVGVRAATAGGAGHPGAGGAQKTRYKQAKLESGAGFFGGIPGQVADTTNSIIKTVMSMTHGGGGPGNHPSDGVDKDILKLFECTDPRECSAGWDMPWSDKIINMVKGWRMSIFGMSIGLNELQSGSIALFEKLASAIFSGIRYSFYFGDGKSNAQVLADRSCNCYDGAQFLQALAHAMGLGGGLVNGFWGSIPHTWFQIGSRVFDTTAFQKRGTWRGPAQGAGIGTTTQKVLQFVFNIKGPIYDKDGLVNEIKQVVRTELNDSVDVIV